MNIFIKKHEIVLYSLTTENLNLSLPIDIGKDTEFDLEKDIINNLKNNNPDNKNTKLQNKNIIDFSKYSINFEKI